MRVTLIFVAEPEVVGFPVWTPTLTTPLLAACLRRAGHDVDIRDTRFLGPTPRCRERGFRAAVADLASEVVAISFMSHSRDEAFRYARICKRDGRVVVGGGAHATMMPEDLLASGLFDVVVQGEGENALVEVVESLPASVGARPRVARGAPFDLRHYPPLRDVDPYRDVYDPPRMVPISTLARITGMDRGTLAADLGSAVTDDLMVDRASLAGVYSRRFPARREFRSIYLELGRGCPYRCRYCTVQSDTFATKRQRSRSLRSVLAELDYFVSAFGVNYVILTDSIAPAYDDFARFVGVMKRRYSDVEFSFNCTASHMTSEVARVLEGANCLVWFGFESGSDRMLRYLRKPATSRLNHRAAELCNAHGIRFGANILLGVPGEREDDYARTLDFLRTVRPYSPNPNILTPLPGTRSYTEFRDAGLLVDPGDYRSWTAEDVRRHGRGPLHGMDYGRVLDQYDEILALDRTGERVHLTRDCHLKPHPVD